MMNDRADSDMAATGVSGWLRTFGWAAYLACSWTWCIGMFLPVLLVRDYGVWGFVVFAAPNVVGAAAMGWVLADRERADSVRRKHRLAALVFSVVTVAFQVFFLMWFLGVVNSAYPTAAPSSTGRAPPSVLAYIIAGVVSSAIMLIAARRQGPVILAAVLWVASMSALLYVARKGEFSVANAAAVPPVFGLGDLALLAPVCMFGFALCPYLDLTFLRAAAAQSPPGNRAAFSLGFGVLFFAMILFTLGYAWMFRAVVSPGSQNSPVRPAMLGIVSGHIIFQLAFTIWVHAREAASRELFSTTTRLRALAVGAVATSAIGLATIYGWLPGVAGLSGGELVYRLFMSFYGLIFPAYVYLCMIPTPDGHSGIAGPEGRRKVLVLGAAITIAAPMFWMGFIERETVWLAPGLAVVLLSRLLVRGMRRVP